MGNVIRKLRKIERIFNLMQIQNEEKFLLIFIFSKYSLCILHFYCKNVHFRKCDKF